MPISSFLRLQQSVVPFDKCLAAETARLCAEEFCPKLETLIFPAMRLYTMATVVGTFMAGRS